MIYFDLVWFDLLKDRNTTEFSTITWPKVQMTTWWRDLIRLMLVGLPARRKTKNAEFDFPHTNAAPLRDQCTNKAVSENVDIQQCDDFFYIINGNIVYFCQAVYTAAGHRPSLIIATQREARCVMSLHIVQDLSAFGFKALRIHSCLQLNYRDEGLNMTKLLETMIDNKIDDSSISRP